jgi:hypothetical protein
MNWSRRHTTLAGIGLIVVVNAMALAGVAYNRSGEPESALRLSERELRRPQQVLGFERENSGMALKLQWRVRTTANERDHAYYAHIGRWGDPVWLDHTKLAELGIEVPSPADPHARRRYEKLTSKEVLLVLELDGEHHRAVLAQARERAERLQAEAASARADGDRRFRAEMAAKRLEFEQSSAGRLYVVDAGRDAGALRAKYPDRSSHAIVQGRIRPTVGGNDWAPQFGAQIEGLSVEEVNVAFEMRKVFEGAAVEHGAEVPRPRFEAVVAYGRRLEPWLIGAARKD